MARSRSASSGKSTAPGQAQAGASHAPSVLMFRNRPLSVFRGSEVNAYGDTSDVGTLLMQNVPVAIAETSQTAFDPATQRPQTIRSVTCIAPAWSGIIETDTLQDASTGIFYMISSIEARPGPGYYPADLVLTLRVRSGVSVSSD